MLEDKGQSKGRLTQIMRLSAVMRQATAVHPLGSFENSGSNKTENDR